MDPSPSFIYNGIDHVSVYLAIVGTSSLPKDWEINVIFTIFVYNQVLDSYLCFQLNGDGRRFSETKRVWAFPKLISKKSLKEINVWEIREFSKLGHDIWYSQEFVVEDVKWKIELYPDGAPGYEGFLSVHLVCVSAKSYLAHQRVKAKYWMHLEGYGFCRTWKISRWFTSSAKTWGHSRPINLGRLHDAKNGFLIDDTCTLEVGLCVQVVVL